MAAASPPLRFLPLILTPPIRPKPCFHLTPRLPRPSACGIIKLGMTWTWTELREWREIAVRRPLVTAFTLSLIIHVLLFGFWRIGKHLGWWQHQATWLLKITQKKSRPPAVQLSSAQQAALRERQIPLTFVEVDPSAAVKEAPKDAKHYGVQSTKAANPDPKVETETAKIDGSQDKTLRLDDVRKPLPFPLQPAIAPEKGADDLQQEAKRKETLGDLARTKPNDGVARVGSGEEAVQKRARTIQEALAQKNLAGEKTLQPGGVRARGKVSLDVTATPFASYDAAFIAAVQQRWYNLLDSYAGPQQSGRVVVEFRLHHDGRISDMLISETDVPGSLSWLCQSAITDNAPYAKWPDDMRRVIHALHREVRFTFYYN